jgi:hypothetical protein
VNELEPAGHEVEILALRRHWFALQSASVEVDGTELGLRVRSIFGVQRLWQLPLDVVGVVLRGQVDEPGGSDAEAFVDPLTIRYLATATPLAGPNVVLLFDRPQRLPPMTVRGGLARFLPWRASGSSEGAWVDGVGLRARDPVRTAAALVRAGAEPVSAPTRWMAARRATSGDPALVARSRAAERRVGWAPWLSTALMAAFIATAAWTLSGAGSWGLLASAGLLGLAVLLPGLLRRGRLRW